MNKIISKILIIFIIAVILFEFSFSNICNASGGIDSGTINTISNLIGGIVSIILWIPKLIITGTLWLADDLVITTALEKDGKTSTAGPVATPFDIFFNHYKLLRINFFDRSDESGQTVQPKIKDAVAMWFYIIRAIALIILLLILIYVGIRMALSTVAEQRVKYRKMFFDWVCSIILVFVLQYLAIFLIYLNDAIVSLIEGLISGEDGLGQAVSRILTEALIGVGTGSIMAFLVYAMITIQTLFFFIAYVNRMLKVAFLIMISPLITITYSIDKMGDGKAQALESWLKEFIFTILIQPFDCIMYLAFVSAAVSLLGANNSNTFLESLGFNPEVNEIANGVLAILCLKFINDGEKVIRQIFNFSDDNSATSMAAGAAVAVMAMQKAQQMSKKTTKIAGTGAKFGKALTQDSKLLGKITNNKSVEKILNTAKNVTDKIKDIPAIKNIQKTIKGVKKLTNRAFTSKGGKIASRVLSKSSAVTLAAMSAAMLYASGSNGALESSAAGINMYGSLDKRFSSSLNSIAAEGQKPLQEMEDKSREDLGRDIDDMTDQLAEEGLTEEQMDQVDELDQEATDAENDADETREKALEEKKAERDEQRADLDSQIANMEALIAARPNVSQSRYDDLERLKREREALGDQEELSEEDIAEVDNREEVKASREIAEKKKRIANTARDRKDAMQQMAEFDTEEAAKKRLDGYSRPVKDSELEAQADRILALISAIQAQKKIGDTTETDTSTENVLDEKDDATAERTRQHLIGSIRSAVVRGSDFDIEEYINDHIGVDSTSRGTLGYYLASAISDYKDLENRRAYAERVVKPAKSLGFDGDDVKSRMYETAIEPRAQRQERKSRHTG